MFVLYWETADGKDHEAKFDSREVADGAYFKLARMRDVSTASLSDEFGTLRHFGR